MARLGKSKRSATISGSVRRVTLSFDPRFLVSLFSVSSLRRITVIVMVMVMLVDRCCDWPGSLHALEARRARWKAACLPFRWF